MWWNQNLLKLLEGLQVVAIGFQAFMCRYCLSNIFDRNNEFKRVIVTPVGKTWYYKYTIYLYCTSIKVFMLVFLMLMHEDIVLAWLNISWRCSSVIGSLSLPALKCLSSAAGCTAAETLCLRRDSGTDVTVVAAKSPPDHRNGVRLFFVAAVLICCTFIVLFIIMDTLDSGSHWSKKCSVFLLVCLFLSSSALGHCCVIVLCFVTSRGHVAQCRLFEEGMELCPRFHAFFFFTSFWMSVCVAAAL